MEISGRIIVGERMEPVQGSVVVEDGTVAEVVEEETESEDVVLPAFVNAHTHIGDSVAKEAGRGLPLDEVVAPPNSLKHRILEDSSREEKREAMARTIEQMRSTGVGTFVDFREGGVEGTEDIGSALELSDTSVEAFVMGSGPPEVLDLADGYGASGARDDDFEEERRAAREHGKPFGIHAGERDPDDIDGALAYDPDYLVHMVHARDDDFEVLENEGVPVAVCPRCNLVIPNVDLPPVERLVEHTTVALGTDNVMLNSASMWREMEFASKLFDVPDEVVLRMATVNGARLVGRDDVGVVEEGKRARLVVLDGSKPKFEDSHDLVATVVRRSGPEDVKRVVLR